MKKSKGEFMSEKIITPKILKNGKVIKAIVKSERLDNLNVEIRHLKPVSEVKNVLPSASERFLHEITLSDGSRVRVYAKNKEEVKKLQDAINSGKTEFKEADFNAVLADKQNNDTPPQTTTVEQPKLEMINGLVANPQAAPKQISEEKLVDVEGREINSANESVQVQQQQLAEQKSSDHVPQDAPVNPAQGESGQGGSDVESSEISENYEDLVVPVLPEEPQTQVKFAGEEQGSPTLTGDEMGMQFINDLMAYDKIKPFNGENDEISGYSKVDIPVFETGEVKSYLVSDEFLGQINQYIDGGHIYCQKTKSAELPQSRGEEVVDVEPIQQTQSQQYSEQNGESAGASKPSDEIFGGQAAQKSAMQKNNKSKPKKHILRKILQGLAVAAVASVIVLGATFSAIGPVVGVAGAAAAGVALGNAFRKANKNLAEAERKALLDESGTTSLQKELEEEKQESERLDREKSLLELRKLNKEKRKQNEELKSEMRENDLELKK